MKINKRQYTKKLEILNAKQAEIEQALQDADATEGGSLWTAEMIAESEIFDAWNELHDAKDDVKAEIQDLHSEWNTRNWTAGDWISWELVAANID